MFEPKKFMPLRRRVSQILTAIYLLHGEGVYFCASVHSINTCSDSDFACEL